MANPIIVIGLGKLGGALVRGLRAVDEAIDVYGVVRTAEDAARAQAEFGIPVTAGYIPLLGEAAAILLCVPPAQAADVCAGLSRNGALPPSTPILSTAAGVTIRELEQAMGNSTNPVVRAMPNTLCRIGRGMTVLCPGTHADARSMALAEQLFGAIGGCALLDEARIDIATALSASSPAFVFLLIEAFVQAGVMGGLTVAAARELIVASFVGSAAMLAETGQHPAELRDEVTTPGGCTIAGIVALERHGVRAGVIQAVVETAAAARGLGRRQETHR